MVHVFHYCISSRMPGPVFKSYLETLPLSIQKKITAYRQWEDAERSLAGYILLRKGLEILNLDPVDFAHLKYGTFKKPHLDHQAHFNISHSGNYTVCAISREQEVGVDIELIKVIPMGDFTEFFEATEWQRVMDSPDPVTSFYQLWTKKEAFLKLVGAGLNVPLNKVIIEDNTINWNEEILVVQEITIDSLHVCHLCTSAPAPGVRSLGILL